MRLKKLQSGNIFDVLNYIILFILSLTTIYPLLYVLSYSLSGVTAIIKGQVYLWPVDVTLDGYKLLFQDNQIWISYLNTIIYTVVGTFISIIITLSGAYALSRKHYSLRSPIMLMIAATMYFSGGLVPQYILINQLGMYNTRWAILIPGAVSAWNLVIARVYFQDAIPESLTEAATIDGATEIHIFFKIAMPLAIPIIAVLSLFYGLGRWNEYFNAMIYLRDYKLQPISLYLRRLLLAGAVKHEGLEHEQIRVSLKTIAEIERLKYCTIVVTLFPVLCSYPFLQKYFITGLTVGAIKE